jgi:hypothetical protein
VALRKWLEDVVQSLEGSSGLPQLSVRVTSNLRIALWPPETQLLTCQGQPRVSEPEGPVPPWSCLQGRGPIQQPQVLLRRPLVLGVHARVSDWDMCVHVNVCLKCVSAVSACATRWA